jgi:predicted nucleic-acid-binding Zn-ribbon protein
MNINNKCPKCSGEFEEGYVPSQAVNSSLMIKQSWFSNLTVVGRGLINTKISGPQPILIRTFRCKNCGYLENYAQ